MDYDAMFYSLVGNLKTYGYVSNVTSRSHISRLAGAFKNTLADSGVPCPSAEALRVNYFNRVAEIGVPK